MGLLSVFYLNAQDTRLLKAADDSYELGEKEYNRGNYAEAAPDLEVVVENIPISSDSRKYITMRFEANIMLIDTYFKHLNNLPSACRCLNSFLDDLNKVKDDGILKAKDLLRYLGFEKDFDEYIRQCNNFNSIEDKKSDFENNIFNEEFDDEE